MKGNTTTYFTESILNNQKMTVKIIDLFGRESEQTNQPLIYIYDDGTVEKKIIVE